MHKLSTTTCALAVAVLVIGAACGGGTSRSDSTLPVAPTSSIGTTRTVSSILTPPTSTAATTTTVDRRPLRLVEQRLTLATGRTLDLTLPEGFKIGVAAENLGRVRFLAVSPDGRVFAPDLASPSDNSQGALNVLEDFDAVTGRFRRTRKYLTGLRNPNSVAFYTDAAGTTWLYVALTDRLVRTPYRAGDTAPREAPATVARFPDFGNSVAQGGWHLTRTVAVQGDAIYVSVGSSCNACVETEELRAAIVRMKPDGSDLRVIASGLRNAVGIRFVRGQLYATAMGADHLGDDRPDELLYRISDNKQYGWPYCYQTGGQVLSDARFAAPPGYCDQVERAIATFPAHSAPLGLEYFDRAGAPALDGYFLVALHGSSNQALRRGYQVLRVAPDGASEPLVSGFQSGTTVTGRPVDVLRFGDRAFLLSDDFSGAIYLVSW